MNRVIFASLFAGILTMCLLLTDSFSFAAEPPKEPILRIETGRHTSQVDRLGVDAAGRWAVTASNDKTVRVWELPSGNLIRTIRPPIAHGNEGRLFSVAISPDGSTIACGGDTMLGSNNSYTVYLFNRVSGAMVGRISGLRDDFGIGDLAFSPDGKFLVVALSGKGGLHLYHTKNWTLAGYDDSYTKLISRARFSSDGKLVTTSSDGYIRLYTVNTGALKLINIKKLPGGKSPAEARFSPDNTKIAISYGDSLDVSVLSVSDLSFLYSPDTNRISSSIHTLAWSPDSTQLIAGAAWYEKTDQNTKFFIRQWSAEGRGAYTDIMAANSSIFDMATLPDGSLIYVSGEPALGMIDRSGTRALALSPLIADYRILDDKFRISPDGKKISFSYERRGNSPATFDLITRNLVSGTDHSLTPPMTTPQGYDAIQIINEADKGNSGFLQELAKTEKGREVLQFIAAVGKHYKAWAVASHDKSIVTGDAFILFRTSQKGENLWTVNSYGQVWSVNISPDALVAVVAYADGTIRWHRMADGKELVAFFPHADKKRWIMWTPEGYFDASPGGADLIGYHLNQGKDKEANFIPTSYLYDVFYRPDIVQAKLRGDDISPLITLTATEALKSPPPEVKITTIPPTTADATTRICYRVKSTGGGIGEVRLFQNGKLIKSDGFYREVAAKKESGERIQLAGLNSRAIYQQQRGLVAREKGAVGAAISKRKGDLLEECVAIETISGENEISLAAFNATNTVQSFMDSATFISTRPAAEPKLYILAVGIDKYRDPSIDLKYAAKDAGDFMAKLPEKARSIYKPANIHQVELLNANAGKRGIQKAIDELAAKVKHGDGFIFFNASHGVLLQNQYYIVTSDFNGDLNNTTALISSNEIVEISKKIKSLSQLFIFDTCHAGGVDNIVSGLYDARMSVMAKKMGLHIFASAGSVQTAMDGYKGNGLYTHTLLQGIENGSDVDREKSGKVSVINLGRYTKEKTTEISTKLGHPQTPFIINFGRDNPLFTVK